MNLIGLKEFRQKVEKYIDTVNSSKQGLIVTKRGKPLFRIEPIEESGQWETLIDFTKLQKGGINVEDLLKRL